MTHDDYHVEPIPGLPERLPQGERLLWQGRPDTWELARASMNIHWVIGWFAALSIWRGVMVTLDLGLAPGLVAASWFVLLGAGAAGLILAAAWIFARSTVYTITSERVVMRIGAALTVTLNLPFRWIARADMMAGKSGNGSIFLDLKGETKVSYLVCWPHIRPWHITRTQPALRAIPDVHRVAGILGAAAEARVAEVAADIAAADPIAAE